MHSNCVGMGSVQPSTWKQAEAYHFPCNCLCPAVSAKEEAALFELYKKEHYDSVAKKFPLLNRQEVTAMVSDMWHSVDDEEIESLEAKFLGKKTAPMNAEVLQRESLGFRVYMLARL